MAKPKDKIELLEAIDEAHRSFVEEVNSFDADAIERDFEFDGLNQNVRDVVAHLWEWQLMFLRWYEVGMIGEKPDMPAKNYSWKQLPELNVKIQEKNIELSLKQSLENLKVSHEKILEIVESHTDEELFKKKRYPWTGSTSLAAYITSAAWSHFNWAMKLIRKHKRTAL